MDNAHHVKKVGPTVSITSRVPDFFRVIISVTVQIRTQVFLVISVWI